MRTPRRRRPLRRAIAPAPTGVDLGELADKAEYVGSPEHKVAPSFAGPPRPRADATKCDPKLTSQEELTGWLQEALRRGTVGAPFEGHYPRYVWARRDGVVYEGRLVNRELGHYKGYPLAPEESPGGLP